MSDGGGLTSVWVFLLKACSYWINTAKTEDGEDKDEREHVWLDSEGRNMPLIPLLTNPFSIGGSLPPKGKNVLFRASSQTHSTFLLFHAIGCIIFHA